MNSYGRSSRRVYGELHPDLQMVFKTVLRGMDHTLRVGYRGEGAQAKAFDSGNSKVQWPDSYHNRRPSMAVDASPYPLPLNWGDDDRNEYEKFRYFAFYVLGVADVLYTLGAISHQLEWGGDWDSDKDVTDNNFNDLLHFQLRRK